MAGALIFITTQEKPIPILHEEIYNVEYATEFDFGSIKSVYNEYTEDIVSPKVDTTIIGEATCDFEVKKTSMKLNVKVEDTDANN